MDFIGFSITQTEEDGEKCVYLDQQQQLDQLLDSFERSTLQPKDSPMATKHLMHSDSTPLSENHAAQYKHCIGPLNYFSRSVRFDIALAVSRLSSKVASPDAGAWKALVHLLGYLSCTTHFRIGGRMTDNDFFDFYVDLDHAGDRQSSTKSQTGYLLFLNNFPVDWCSRKQPDTSVSPAQAEIYAMHEAVYACRLVQWVAEEMGMRVDWPFKIQTDSSQAFSFQHNTCPNSKIRGCFDLRNQTVKELRDKGIVQAKKINRELNVADMLTHCLSGKPFNQHLIRAQNLRNLNCRAGCVFTSLFCVQLRIND